MKRLCTVVIVTPSETLLMLPLMSASRFRQLLLTTEHHLLLFKNKMLEVKKYIILTLAIKVMFAGLLWLTLAS